MKAASSKLAPAFNTATAANVAPAFNATAKGVAPAFNGVAPALSNSLGVASLPSATYNLKTLQNKQVYNIYYLFIIYIIHYIHAYIMYVYNHNEIICIHYFL